MKKTLLILAALLISASAAFAQKVDTFSLYKIKGDKVKKLMGGFTRLNSDAEFHNGAQLAGFLEETTSTGTLTFFNIKNDVAATFSAIFPRKFQVVEITRWKCSCPPRLALKKGKKTFVWDTEVPKKHLYKQR